MHPRRLGILAICNALFSQGPLNECHQEGFTAPLHHTHTPHAVVAIKRILGGGGKSTFRIKIIEG